MVYSAHWPAYSMVSKSCLVRSASSKIFPVPKDRAGPEAAEKYLETAVPSSEGAAVLAVHPESVVLVGAEKSMETAERLLVETVETRARLTVEEAGVHAGQRKRLGFQTDLWGYGRGGSGANHPEYERRLTLMLESREEYMARFPEERRFIEAGVDHVPSDWINQRLAERGERWQVSDAYEGGYILPALIENE